MSSSSTRRNCLTSHKTFTTQPSATKARQVLATVITLKQSGLKAGGSLLPFFVQVRYVIISHTERTQAMCALWFIFFPPTFYLLVTVHTLYSATTNRHSGSQFLHYIRLYWHWTGRLTLLTTSLRRQLYKVHWQKNTIREQLQHHVLSKKKTKFSMPTVGPLRH